MKQRALWLALLLWIAPAVARDAPTLHEWMSLAAADAPSISPDGRSVAYIMATPDWDKDGIQRQIWVVGADGSGRRQLTSEATSSWRPRWSPDGKRLAFLSAREGGTQVYVMRVPDGPAVRLTGAEKGVDDFRWAPNGRQIAFLSGAAVRPAAAEPKEFHVVGHDARNIAALWLIAVPAEPTGPQNAVGLTDPAAFVADDIAWSPDSRRIAFHASTVGDPYEFWTYDIYVLEVASKSVRRVVETPGPDFFPIWSPDGKEIAYRTYVTGPGQDYAPTSLGDIAVVRAEGGAPRIGSDSFDEQATAIAWTSAGIYFVGRVRTYEHLFRLDPVSKAVRRVTEPLESVSFGFSITPDGRHVAFTGADAGHYQEIFFSPLGTTLTPRRLTSVGGDQLA